MHLSSFLVVHPPFFVSQCLMHDACDAKLLCFLLLGAGIRSTMTAATEQQMHGEEQ
jgi:hypothetical protein